VRGALLTSHGEGDLLEDRCYHMYQAVAVVLYSFVGLFWILVGVSGPEACTFILVTYYTFDDRK
jgi:hypothetical protein